MSSTDNSVDAQPGPGSPAFAQRILREQFRIVTKNEDGVARGEVEPLHDVRVAVRRIRALLTVIAAPLHLPGASAIEERFDSFQKQLGAARDADVLIRTLQMPEVRKQMSEDPGYIRVIQHLEVERAGQKREVARLMKGDTYATLKRDAERFIETGLDLPSGDFPTAAALGSAALENALARTRKRSNLPASFPAVKAHKLRIACRKARYLAEFFAEEIGPPLHKLAQRLKAVQDVLGDIHDIDVLLETMSREHITAPAKLIDTLHASRSKLVGRFRKTWGKLDKPCFHKKTEKALRGAR